MIRHLVMFKLRDFDSADGKIQAAKTVQSELMSMKNKIEFIRKFEVGINFTINDAAFDLVINSSFNTREDLESYQVHPSHQALISFNKQYSVKKVIVDYEY